MKICKALLVGLVFTVFAVGPVFGEEIGSGLDPDGLSASTPEPGGIVLDPNGSSSSTPPDMGEVGSGFDPDGDSAEPVWRWIAEFLDLMLTK